jgi:hypothetical protein
MAAFKATAQPSGDGALAGPSAQDDGAAKAGPSAQDDGAAKARQKPGRGFRNRRQTDVVADRAAIGAEGVVDTKL